jgi:hypothetical protein
MSSTGRYRPAVNPLAGDPLCSGIKGAAMCQQCGRYMPGPKTPRHTHIPLGLSDKACGYRKERLAC